MVMYCTEYPRSNLSTSVSSRPYYDSNKVMKHFLDQDFDEICLDSE